ncbi:MAG: hypothetical protein KBD67_01015 [Anaerolineaceae bacterium]|nr:hypothetical protein [Anaerolineaceae bacterium]
MAGNSISLFGWLLIIFVVFLTIGLFVSLFTHAKKNSKDQTWISMMQNAGTTLRDPFGAENKKLNELSTKVQQLNPEAEKLQNMNNEHPNEVNE